MPFFRKLLVPALAGALALAAHTARAEAVNLISNGDFEAGFTGFVSDYRQSASGCIGCVGVAPTTLGWYAAPGLVFPFGDHTSGSGQMLQYDPPAAGNPRIWAQSVEVEAGRTYVFSGWLREANSEASPNNGRVGVYAGGQLLGSIDAPDERWDMWSFEYTAAASGLVELALRDLYPTTWYGTYTAIDDLAFVLASGTPPPATVPLPTSASLALLGLALLRGLRPGRHPRRPARHA